MSNIAITTECVADLPQSLLEEKDIDIIYYDIATETGLFRDTDEVDANNIMEYMIGGSKKAQSVVPNANDYKNFFKRKLEDYDELIHICISSGISNAIENATLARAKMGIDGRRIHIVDSKCLSSGQGLIAMEAARCRDEGMKSAEIVSHLENYRSRVYTTFLANNADYLYYNDKVSKTVMKICNKFFVHPVLWMKDGKLTLKRVFIGSYEKAAARYIAGVLKNPNSIDSANGFLTYAGCGHEMLNGIQKQLREIKQFDDLHEQQASATVSCNCGPLTFGILFVYNEGCV